MQQCNKHSVGFEVWLIWIKFWSVGSINTQLVCSLTGKQKFNPKGMMKTKENLAKSNQSMYFTLFLKKKKSLRKFPF